MLCGCPVQNSRQGGECFPSTKLNLLGSCECDRIGADNKIPRAFPELPGRVPIQEAVRTVGLDVDIAAHPAVLASRNPILWQARIGCLGMDFFFYLERADHVLLKSENAAAYDEYPVVSAHAPLAHAAQVSVAARRFDRRDRYTARGRLLFE